MAWGAGADSEVVARLRMASMWRLVNACRARRGKGRVRANWSRTARLPICRLLAQTLVDRQRGRAATSYSADVLSYTLLCRNCRIPSFVGTGAQTDSRETDQR